MYNKYKYICIIYIIYITYSIGLIIYIIYTYYRYSTHNTYFISSSYCLCIKLFKFYQNPSPQNLIFHRLNLPTPPKGCWTPPPPKFLFLQVDRGHPAPPQDPPGTPRPQFLALWPTQGPPDTLWLWEDPQRSPQNPQGPPDPNFSGCDPLRDPLTPRGCGETPREAPWTPGLTSGLEEDPAQLPVGPQQRPRLAGPEPRREEG